MVHPGDIVVADADGVVIVQSRMAEEVLFAAEQIELNEKEKRAEYAASVLRS